MIQLFQIKKYPYYLELNFYQQQEWFIPPYRRVIKNSLTLCEEYCKSLSYTYATKIIPNRYKSYSTRGFLEFLVFYQFDG